MTVVSGQPIGLIHAFDARITIANERDIGDGPYGRRRYVEVTAAVIDGERLTGRQVGAAGDWMLVGPDGYLRMDVRLQVLTADGAVIRMHYFGPAEANDRMKRAMEASLPTTFADQRIRMHWLLEAGDPRYAWVNQAIFVGESRFQPGADGAPGFEHRVYRVDRPSGSEQSHATRRPRRVAYHSKRVDPVR